MGSVIETSSRAVLAGLVVYGGWLWWHGRLYEGRAGVWTGDLSPPPPRFSEADRQAARDNQDPEPPGLIEMEPNDTAQKNEVNWDQVRHFRPSEFVDHEGSSMLPHIHPRVIYAADALRERLGCPLQISPAPGSMARFQPRYETSQHYARGRRSTALDILPRGCSLREVFNAAHQVRAIGGLGLYPDWEPRPGIHIDTRPRKPDGSLALWMGRDTPGGQSYSAIDWDYIAEATA